MGQGSGACEYGNGWLKQLTKVVHGIKGHGVLWEAVGGREGLRDCCLEMLHGLEIAGGSIWGSWHGSKGNGRGGGRVVMRHGGYYKGVCIELGHMNG
jgi:hypothetical protein